MNLSVVILPAKILADGTHKLRIAMSHNGETRYFVTRFVIPSAKNLKNGQVVGKEIGNANYINMQIAHQIQEIYHEYDLIKEAECYTCSQLLTLIKDNLHRTSLTTFGAISSEWLQIKEKQSNKKSVHLYKLGVDLFQKKFGSEFLLSLLTIQHVYEYDHWMEHSQHLANPTINMRMRVLRSVLHYALTRQYVQINSNPFDGYKERPESVRDVALPLPILRNLINLQTEDVYISTCRDCLLLSFYLCGMNLADMLSLDLSGDSIKFIRTKTQSRRQKPEMTEFNIPDEAKEIISRNLQPDGKHLQFSGRTTPSEMNNFFFRHLPKLKETIGYNGRLIFYSMRKSFAQIANELGIQERVIAYCIGDIYNERRGGSIGYYIKTNKKMADEAISKVLTYIKESDPE